MGNNCSCVREQNPQPTMNLAGDQGIEGDPKLHKDAGARCESEVADDGEEKIDIDLNDPEVQKAGIKIQVI